MSRPIEDYAFIGDCHTSALVAKDSSIDWFCVPRFSSDAIFSLLLGKGDEGHWRFISTSALKETSRRYRPGTLILETDLHTESGSVRVIDFMPMNRANPTLVRQVVGLEGEVELKSEMRIRFAYGRVAPWITCHKRGFTAVVGPDALELQTPVPISGDNRMSEGTFRVRKGETIPFMLSWHSSFEASRGDFNCDRALEETEAFWTKWIGSCHWQGPWWEAVERSLLTLKGLIYLPTGAFVAAPTTSLPEQLGQDKNWDYRFCWLRDASYSLYALVTCGCTEEAKRWSEWLLKSVGGDASAMAVLYSVEGNRLYSESEVPWLSGYEGSAPVRVGNEAVNQFQLDIYGEVIDAFHFCRRKDIRLPSHAWDVQKEVALFVESVWRRADEGIWEKRKDPKHNVHSKALAWVAIDRTVKAMETWHLEGPLDRFRALRHEMHQEICEKGFSRRKNSFVVAYGSEELDGSLLLLPQVGFLPIRDPRILGTIEAIEKNLSVDGLIARYRNGDGKIEGEKAGEGTFLITSFWYLEDLILLGRHDEARALFERLLSLRNDVGLLSEEYDVHGKRLLGNFPQALSHLAIINAAAALNTKKGPVQDRAAQ